MKILAINLPNLNLEYFSKRGLDFEVKHINLDLKAPLKYLYNLENKDFYTPDLHDILNKQFPKFEQSFILYGYVNTEPKNSSGGYAYHTKLNSGSRWASVRIDGYENAYAIHELHHLLCGVINIDFKDYTPKDFMDYTPVNGTWITYYKNDQPDNPNSNHGQTWKNIIPFLPRLKAIKYDVVKQVTIVRAYGDDKQQLGDLIVEEFKCKTMELSWRDNKQNVSSIPKGEYDVVWTFSPRFMRYTYEILNVPNRSGIRIHTGNYFFQINGCIILGDSYGDLNKDRHADIMNSTKTLKAFEDFMSRKPFKLVIK